MYVSQNNFTSIYKFNKVAGNGIINNTFIWKYDIFLTVTEICKVF